MNAHAGSTALAPEAYWEQRARRFAAQGEGLAAVCSYGMPGFYNLAIQLSQRLALSRWLRVPAGARVLDLGCGVGRWSCRLAASGAVVTGVDLSATMVAVAQRRAHEAGLSARCRFLVQDLAELDAGTPYDVLLAVTVLQHILDPAKLRRAVARMAAHLAVGGRMVLLEAAPQRATHRCDSAVFTARARATYLRLFESCGLRLSALGGVDPAPFRLWLLPHLRRLPRCVAVAATAAASALSLPVDGLIGRRAVAHSWHAVFVLEHARQASDAH
ncbi:MAG: SAM-dependent methyltransferase [Steroidobacteraceae bacterium]